MQKRPSRKEARQKHKTLSPLQSLLSLEPFLPRPDRREQERLDARKKKALAEFSGIKGRAALEQLAPDPRRLAALVLKRDIISAREEYTQELGKARDDILDGIERGDLAPLQHHLAVFGFLLFEDPAILHTVADWWLGAKYGEESCIQSLTVALRALRPGGGPLRQRTPEQARAKGAERKRRYDKKVTKQIPQALEKIQSAIRKDIANLPRQFWKPAQKHALALAKERIKKKHIADALQSTDPAIKKAGKKAQKLQARGKL